MIAPVAEHTPIDKVQVLQRKLYRAAKEAPQRKFGVLYDKLYRLDVLREAWQRVRRNRGSAGVDGQTIADVEAYSGERLLAELAEELREKRYCPLPVRRVYIPKPGKRNQQRALGIPTVSDRIAQMVVKRYLEPIVEKIFHPDSYGYRPKKSAIEAVGMARQRCWRYDWALHLDVTGCFDNIDRTLLMRAVRKHTDCPWVVLYIERWLAAPVQLPDGSLFGVRRPRV